MNGRLVYTEDPLGVPCTVTLYGGIQFEFRVHTGALEHFDSTVRTGKYYAGAGGGSANVRYERTAAPDEARVLDFNVRDVVLITHAK